MNDQHGVILRGLVAASWLSTVVADLDLFDRSRAVRRSDQRTRREAGVDVRRRLLRIRRPRPSVILAGGSY